MAVELETVEQQSWLRRNLTTVLIFAYLICHSFISEYISFKVYISAAILISANILFCFSENRNVANWLKTNLLALAVIAGLLAFTYLIGGTMIYLAALVPESVAATFPFILAIGFVLYLIGLGFHLVQKITKI